MHSVLSLAGAVALFAAVPVLLHCWLRRRGWVRILAPVVAVDPDGCLRCRIGAPLGEVIVAVPPFGEATATVGDRIELHHPPDRPEAATHGSAFGYLAAAVLAVLLGLACLAGFLSLD